MNASEMWVAIDYDNLHEDDFPCEGDFILAEVNGNTYLLLDCVAVSNGDDTWTMEFYQRDGRRLPSGNKITRWVDMRYVLPEA